MGGKGERQRRICGSRDEQFGGNSSEGVSEEQPASQSVSQSQPPGWAGLGWAQKMERGKKANSRRADAHTRIHAYTHTHSHSSRKCTTPSAMNPTSKPCISLPHPLVSHALSRNHP
jgi:hypothetical protein